MARSPHFISKEMATFKPQLQPNGLSNLGIIIVQKAYQGIGHFEDAEQLKSRVHNIQ